MNIVISKLASSPRVVKRSITYLVDSGIHIFAYALSAFLTIKSLDISTFGIDDLFHAVVTILGSILLLAAFGFYKAVNRFVSLKILLTVSLGTAFSSLIFYFLGSSFNVAYVVPSSTVIYGAVLCILLGGSRLLVRSYFSTRFNTLKKRVVIYGAGAAGRQLALSLINGHDYYPVAFVDDDDSLNGVIMQGIRVHSPQDLNRIVERFGVENVLLALPSISRSQRKLIINRIEKVGVTVQTIPSMSDIVAGKMKIDEFQDVEIEDLLGRDPIPPVDDLLNKNIKSKSVMVTGAGGSIGSELCRQIIELEPKCLVLFEVSEYSLYRIEKELVEVCKQKLLEVEIKPILGNVLNKERLTRVLEFFNVKTVYHTAAYKHVPMVEHNTVEGVKNNILGTYNAALAAIDTSVENFVLISTDKAVRPTNVMGATKRFAELVLQGLARKGKGTSGICFSMVRFGNVLGSSGSVVPVFKRQIRAGGPVTVTHPDIIRYFMTIPEAAQLVIQAGAMAKGGDVFVLDMGEPVKIVELAYKLISLMGLEVKGEQNPDGDIEVIYSGLRPGEKLYEELLIGEDVEGTSHPRIMTAHEKYLSWEPVYKLLTRLESACGLYDLTEIRNVLLEAPTDFKPRSGISDYLWSERVSENVVPLPKDTGL